jgi:lysozyme
MKSSGNLNLLFRIILIPSVLLLVMLLIVKAPGWIREIISEKRSPAPPVCSFGIIMPVGYTVHGIDVSKHQGEIDWKRVSNMQINNIRVSFAFIKATEGISRQDDKFEKNWKEAGQSGLLRGAYHFYYPSRDAGKQADNFIKMVSLRSGDLPPVVDIEHSNGRKKEKICADLHVFLNRLEKEYSVKPIIYTNINFFTLYLKDSFDEYPLWIAGYFDHDRFYNEFLSPWILWQHSESGKVDGIRGKVDFNVFKGDIEKLKNMTLKK